MELEINFVKHDNTDEIKQNSLDPIRLGTSYKPPNTRKSFIYPTKEIIFNQSNSDEDNDNRVSSGNRISRMREKIEAEEKYKRKNKSSSRDKYKKRSSKSRARERKYSVKSDRRNLRYIPENYDDLYHDDSRESSYRSASRREYKNTNRLSSSRRISRGRRKRKFRREYENSSEEEMKRKQKMNKEEKKQIQEQMQNLLGKIRKFKLKLHTLN